VGIGDSLLTGYGLALGGVSALSWAWWIAWALPGCITLHAVNGATAQHVVRDQLPLLHGRYRLSFGCIGANDLVDLDEQQFASSLVELCSALKQHAEVPAVATLPARLRTGKLSWRQTVFRTQQVNHQIRLAASSLEVILVDLEPALTGRWSMAPNGQHPTSIGQLEAAHVAAAALDGAGVRFARHIPDPGSIEVSPEERRLYTTSVVDRVRGSWTSLVQYRTDRAGTTQGTSPS
jgi:hypothetical protein